MRHLETLLVHRPTIPGEPAAASSTPIYQSATFCVDRQGRWDYSRSGNPTRDVLERQLAELDGARRSFAFASGMAAVSAALRMAPAGSRVLAGIDLYGGTLRLLDDLAIDRGLDLVFVDPNDLDALSRALETTTALLWIETPSNPRLEVVDLSAIAALTRRAGTLLAVDNSILSPYRQRPLELGADLAVQSATKVLGGHSDLTAGVVSVADAELAERLAFRQNAEGTALAPFDSWLLLRGLETLGVRNHQQVENAAEIARRLRSSGVVEQLFSAPESYVISFDTGSLERSRRLLIELELFRATVSFGGVTSSINLPCEMSHASIPERWRSLGDLSPSLVRLSIGIENVADLWADLDRALRRVSSAPRLLEVAR
ncbi:MAG: PLP-dependent transferase [Acidobacteriota bacterium]